MLTCYDNNYYDVLPVLFVLLIINEAVYVAVQISLTAEAYSNVGLTTGHKFIYNMLSAIHVIYNRGYAQHHEWLANNMSSKYPHVFEINN